jgi:shikimate kinase/chorismate mutase
MKDIDRLKGELDALDRELLTLMEKRVDISREIGSYRRTHGLPALAREEQEHGFRASLLGDEENQRWLNAFSRLVVRISRSEQRRRMNVYLTGFALAGVSRIAEALGQTTGLNVLDTDEMLTREAGLGIDEILSKEGESGFRLREHRALIDAARAGSSIVATGEGILSYADNLPILRHSGRVVYLDMPLEKLLEAAPEGEKAEIERRYHAHIARFRETTDVTLRADDPETPETLWDYCIE